MDAVLQRMYRDISDLVDDLIRAGARRTTLERRRHVGTKAVADGLRRMGYVLVERPRGRYHATTVESYVREQEVREVMET